MSVIESMRIEIRGRKMAKPDLNRTKLSVARRFRLEAVNLWWDHKTFDE